MALPGDAWEPALKPIWISGKLPTDFSGFLYQASNVIYDACTLSIHLSLWVLNQSKVYYTKILLTARPGGANCFHHGMQGVIQTTSINTKGQIVCNSAYVTKTLPHKVYCITHEICSCYFQFLDIYWTFLPPAISFCRMVFYVFWGTAYIDT